MKICNKCKSRKSLDEFHRRGNGYQPYCKSCKKIDDAQYRKDNLDYFSQRSKRQRGSLRDLNRELKDNPCFDCQRSFHFSAMQWDHRDPTIKIDSPSRLISFGSKKKFLEEVAKCDLVCACCHAIREWNRSQG